MFVDIVFYGEEWFFELKFDGYCGLCCIENGWVVIYIWEGFDWSYCWFILVEVLVKLLVDQVWIDGEVVVLDVDGCVSFEVL